MRYTALHKEDELLSLIADGDKQAFQAIYNHYWNNVYSTALAYLKSTEWAQDIVQDIFIRVWEKRDHLTRIDNFSSYLFIMVRNELITALRKKWHGSALPDNYLDSLPSNLLDPVQSLDSKQQEALIQKAIDQLSPQQQRIFNLTRQQGLSHEAIARQLGIDKRTVSNHATMALNKLRQVLKDNPDVFLVIYGIYIPVLL